MFKLILSIGVLMVISLEGQAAQASQKPASLRQPMLPPAPATSSSQLQFDTVQKCLAIPKFKRVRVLSIDGGGVRGLIPALVVRQMEKDLKVSITDIFDVFIGNSAGGLLSLILTTPKDDDKTQPKYSAEKVVELIKQMSADIFGGVQKNSLDKTKATLTKMKNALLTGARYSPKALEDFAKTIFGNTKLSETVKPVSIATFDLNSESIQMLSTYLAKKAPLFNFKMADIARATSAAPTYFPVHSQNIGINKAREGVIGGIDEEQLGMVPSETNMQLVDGGIGANNPTYNGVIDLIGQYCDNPKSELPKETPEFHVISLGTGTTKNHYDQKDMGKTLHPLRMVKTVIPGLMSAQTQTSDTATKGLIKLIQRFTRNDSSYERLQANFAKEKSELDDVSAQATANFEEKAREIINNPQYLKTINRLRVQLCEEGVYKKGSGLYKEMCGDGDPANTSIKAPASFALAISSARPSTFKKMSSQVGEIVGKATSQPSKVAKKVASKAPNPFSGKKAKEPDPQSVK